MPSKNLILRIDPTVEDAMSSLSKSCIRSPHGRNMPEIVEQTTYRLDNAPWNYESNKASDRTQLVHHFYRRLQISHLVCIACNGRWMLSVIGTGPLGEPNGVRMGS